MTVLILERVPSSLRGELTRWLLEPKAGVFVGRVTAMIRDRLWEKATKSVKSGSAVLVYQSNTAQGFTMRSFGDPSREVISLEGLQLIRIPLKK